MHVGEHGDDVTRHAAPVGEGSAAGAHVCAVIRTINSYKTIVLVNYSFFWVKKKIVN